MGLDIAKLDAAAKGLEDLVRRMDAQKKWKVLLQAGSETYETSSTAASKERAVELGKADVSFEEKVPVRELVVISCEPYGN